MKKYTLTSQALGALLLIAAVDVASPRPAAAAAPAAAPGPKATLMRLNGAVDKLLRSKTEPGTEADKRVRNEIRDRASDLFDYTELCKRALGEHWAKMAEKQRTDFVATLQELIERNYIRQLRTNLDYEVTYGEEQVEGPEAKIATQIKIRTKGKSTNATIDYRMLQGARGWLVYDVITDEVSLVRNYRSQFQRIIASSGYDGLLNRMKTKLSEEKEKEAKEEKERTAAPAPAAAPKG